MNAFVNMTISNKESLVIFHTLPWNVIIIKRLTAPNALLPIHAEIIMISQKPLSLLNIILLSRRLSPYFPIIIIKLPHVNLL